MKSQLLKMTAVLGFAVFSLNAYSQQSGKGMDMGNMNMDCSKHMGDMKGMKGMEGMKGMDCMGKDAAKPTSLTDGEVKNVDAKAGNVTLKHGAIENMNMGPMTMAFAVKDKSVLSNLKEGSKVKFAVENVDGVPTVTSLVPQK
ncbi:MAG: copper-binding protein [Cytophagaceae bacterium]|nr:MAG: copper-binding protein [Cytophagaceae bacterium]